MFVRLSVNDAIRFNDIKLEDVITTNFFAPLNVKHIDIIITHFTNKRNDHRTLLLT